MDSDNIYALFATNKNAEKDGRWVSYGKSQFLLARAGGSNTRFTNAYATAMKPYQRQQQLGKLSEEEAREIISGPFVDHVLLDWRWKYSAEDRDADPSLPEFREHEIKNDKGEFVVYSKDAAKKVLKDIPDLLGLLIETTSNISTFAPDDMEAAGKNS